jgi:nitrous oxidase accessory protein
MNKLVVCLIVFFMAFPITSYARIVEKKTTNDIQELIQSVGIGDEIQVPPGIYYGNLNINKKVSLIANGNVTIIGNRKGNVVTLSADGITFKGFTVKNSGRMLTHDDAGIKVRSDKNYIVQNKIDHTLHGIYLEKANDNTLDGNKVIGIKSLRSADRGNGIHLFYSNRNHLENNSITQSRDGMYFSFSEKNLIKGNRIFNVRYGLHYMYSNENSFYNNRFFNNIGGAAIMYSNRIKLEKNYFYNNRGLLSFGLLLQTANDNVVKNNYMMMNQKGLFVDQSNRNLFAHNEIVHNNIGIEIWTSSIQNRFTKNQFNSNVIQYSSNGKIDRNRWSSQGIGNAWSDSILFDLDDNGVGDKPYTYSSSYGEILAQNQLGYLFLDSPSLKIYETVKQTISKDQVQIEDPHPISLQWKKENMNVFNILIISTLVVLLFRQFRRKIAHAISVKRMERNVSE